MSLIAVAINKIRDQIGRQGLRKIAFNVSWLFFDKILRMGAALFIGAWVARHLGPQHYGIFNYAIAFSSIFTIIATLGLDAIVVRDLVKHPDQAPTILGGTFMIRLIAGLFSFIICMATVYLLNSNEDPVVLKVAFIVSLTLLAQSFDTIDLYFQSRVQSKYSVIAKNSSFLILAIVKIILLYKKASIIAFAWAFSIEIILNGIFMMIPFRKFESVFILFKFNYKKSIALLQESWSLIFSGLVIMLYMRIDQLMLKELVGHVAVGIYSVAVRISEVWYFIPSVIMTSVYPSIIKTKEVSEQLYIERLQKLYTFMTWTSIGIAVLVTVLSPHIIYFLFRENYSDSALVLSIHVWTGVFVFQGSARGYWLLTERLQIYGMYYTGAACIVNILLNLFLIPTYGPAGAATATLISYFCSVILFPLLVTKTKYSSIQLLKSFLWRMK